MTKYNRMTLEERETIYLSLKCKQTQTSIATLLRRHKSSISPELKRYTKDSLGYLPDRSQEDARRFARRNVSLFRSAKLSSYVIEKLKLGFSPEQISGRMKLENNPIRVSHEAIYKYIYSEDGRRQKLRRTKWYSKKPKRATYQILQVLKLALYLLKSVKQKDILRVILWFLER